MRLASQMHKKPHDILTLTTVTFKTLQTQYVIYIRHLRLGVYTTRSITTGNYPQRHLRQGIYHKVIKTGNYPQGQTQFNVTVLRPTLSTDHCSVEQPIYTAVKSFSPHLIQQSSLTHQITYAYQPTPLAAGFRQLYTQKDVTQTSHISSHTSISHKHDFTNRSHKDVTQASHTSMISQTDHTRLSHKHDCTQRKISPTLTHNASTLLLAVGLIH